LTKNRDFRKKNKKIDWKKEIRENLDRNFTFSIDFTSSRCQEIKRKFRKMIKTKTPDFNISFSWKTVELARYFTPKTKPLTDKLQVAE
jgi:predicted DsbA family dithiol-disulfide isomerase